MATASRTALASATHGPLAYSDRYEPMGSRCVVRAGNRPKALMRPRRFTYL